MEWERGVETGDLGVTASAFLSMSCISSMVTRPGPRSHVFQNRACNDEEIASLLARDRLSKQDSKPIRKNVREQRL